MSTVLMLDIDVPLKFPKVHKKSRDYKELELIINMKNLIYVPCWKTMVRIPKEQYENVKDEMELLLLKEFPFFSAKIIESENKGFAFLLVIYSKDENEANKWGFHFKKEFNLSFWTKPYPSCYHYGRGKDLKIKIEKVNLLKSENLWSKCQEFVNKWNYKVEIVTSE